MTEASPGAAPGKRPWTALTWAGVLLTGYIVGIAAIFMPQPVLLTLLAGLFLGVAVVWLPGVLLAAYLLIPIYKAAVQPWLPIDFTVLLAVLNAVQVFALFRYREIGLTTRGLLVWLALGASITAGALYAQDQSRAIGLVGQWWLLVVAPLMAVPRIAMKPKYLAQFLGTIALLSLVAIGLAVIQTPGLGGDQRLQLLQENTIQSARALLLLPLIGVVYFLVTTRRESWLVLLLVPVGVYGAVATGSRAPLLIFAATIGLLLVSLAVRRAALRRIAVITAIGVLTVGVVLAEASLLPSASLERFGLLFSAIGGDTSDGGSIGTRVGLFGLAWSTFVDNPLLGIGTGGFAGLARESITFFGHEYPHNTLLQFGAELGIVGVILALSVVVLAFVAPTARTAPWVAIRVLVVFFALNALVSGALYEERMLWGLLFLLLCAPAPTGSESGLSPRAASTA